MIILRVAFRFVKWLIVAALVAGLARTYDLLPPDVLPAYWLAVGVALLTISGAAYSAGWNGLARQQYNDAQSSAEQKLRKDSR